jgi:hypothetical protein
LNQIYYLFFFLSFLLNSCTNEPISAAANLSHSTESIILIFSKEQKAEIWSKKPPKELISTFNIKNRYNHFPLGQFSVTSDSVFIFKDLLLEFEDYNLTEVIIFPNDARVSNHLKPCFACPHIITETYAELEMIIRDYTLKK